MTNIWLHSKQSMKGMDLLSVATDVLYTLEQEGSDKSLLKESREILNRGSSLLRRLSQAANAQVSQTGLKDLFILRIVEGLEKNIGLPPSELSIKLENNASELKRGNVTADSIKLFENISDVTMKLTSKSVDELSTSLH